MEFTQDQIAAIVGSKELEIIALRFQINAMADRLKEFESPSKPDLKVVDTGEKNG